MMTTKPFNMTTRRREVLWHIAYTEEVTLSSLTLPRYGWKDVKIAKLLGVNIGSIISELRRSRLIAWRQSGWTITPKGAEALWAPTNP